MILDGIVNEIIEAMLNRMRELETIKAPPMVHGFTWLRIAGIGERAKHGKPLIEPYGSTRKLLGFDDLMFMPAQVFKKPSDDKKVGTQITIGTNAARPLTLSTPIMVSAMAFGLSVTANAKVALAKGASIAGTATNSGDSGFFLEERKHAKYYVVQYNRGHFGNSDEELKRADMVEIRFGQGAMGGYAESIDGEDVDEPLAKQLNVSPGQGVRRPLIHPEIAQGKTLGDVVERLRGITGGVPIGVKIAAGNIEADLDAVIEAGCDFVTIDGGQGGTAGSPEVTINNVGLPLIYAIPRANAHLVKRGVRDKMSLIVTGGLRDAGDFLKALALGADALYTAESAIVAMTYSQIQKVPLGTSPAEMYLYWGKHGDKLDVEEGAKALGNFLVASTQEMAILTAVVGKDHLSHVNMDNLVALTEETHRVTGVHEAWKCPQ